MMREKLAKLGRLWMILSKYDFRGSKPSAVLDDLDKDAFFNEYGIEPAEYISVKDGKIS